MFNVVANKAWKSLDVEGFDDLVECQVLTDYTLQEAGKSSNDKKNKRKKLEMKKEDDEEKSLDEANKPKKVKQQTNKASNKITKIPKTDDPSSKLTSKKTSGKKTKKTTILKTKQTIINTKNPPTTTITPIEDANETAIISKITNKNTNKSNTKKKNTTKLTTKEGSKSTTTHMFTKESMIRWEGLGVPEDILKCLGEMGFVCPTPVQQATLPTAINNRSDIIAAAATGSGKTLAFAIPILTHIMEIEKDREDDDDEEEEEEDDNNNDDDDDRSDNEINGDDGSSEEDDDDDDSSGDDGMEDEDGKINGNVEMEVGESDDDNDDAENDDDDDIENDDDEDIKSENGKNKESNNRKKSKYDEMSDSDEDTSDNDEETSDNDEETSDNDEETKNKDDKRVKKSPMYSLILAPTRELAMQVTQHISNICKYNRIRVTAVVGGISVEKQQRLLKRQPHIVVATPGRLWQLMQMKEPHLSDTRMLRHVVVDEVDRMVERGHFEEVQLIIAYIQAHSSMILRRQVFIFSATLSFVHKKPHRVVLMKKKKMKELTLEDKIDSLKKTLNMSSKPKVIDLTQGHNMSSQRLQELKVSCNIEEKDAMLFHLMVTKPDRTLVFANSKDAIRRLTSLFTLLHHHPSIQNLPLPLHSDMPMRQRLKNLDAFKARDTGLLLATDVAARGLDIASVGRVVHYQVPRTAENYVHRSGRTARSDKGGVSVLMVSPQEDGLYRRIMLALKKTSGLEDIRVDRASFQHHTSIVALARQLEVKEYKQKKERVNADWWRQACKDADLVNDDDDDDDRGGRHDNEGSDVGQERRECEMKRKELMMMMGVTSRKKKNMRQKKK